MAESVLALTPVNSQGGAILTFVFPMVLFLVIAAILWGLFAGWDWPLSRRFRPERLSRSQTAIAEAGIGTVTAPPPGASPSPPAAPAALAPPAPPAGDTAADTAEPEPGDQGTSSAGPQ